MGNPFKSKTRHYAFASSSQLSRKQPKSTLKTVITSSLLTGQPDLLDAAKIAYVSGFNYKIDRSINYARSKYFYGLPESTLHGYPVKTAAVISYLSHKLNKTVVIESIQLGGSNPEFYGEHWVSAADPNWNPKDKWIRIPHISWYEFNHDTQYEFQSKIVYPGPDIRDLPNKIITVPHFPNRRTDIPDYYVASIWTGYESIPDPDDETHSLTVKRYHPYNMRLPGARIILPPGDAWYQVRYHTTDRPDKTLYWKYNTDTGMIPELNVTTWQEKSRYYTPVAVLLQNQAKFNKHEKSDWCKTTKKLTEYWGLDAEEMLDEIMKADSSGAAKEDAFIHFGAPLYSRRTTTRKYIFDYFEYLSKSQSLTTENYLEIQEAGRDGFFLWYKWDQIIVNTISAKKLKKITGYTITVDKTKIVCTAFSGSDPVKKITVKEWEQAYTINTPGGWRDVRFTTGDDDIKDELYIPLNIGVLRNFNASEEEAIAIDSMRVTVFLYQSQKVKWYKSTFGKFIMVIIIIVAAYFGQAWVGEALAPYLSAAVITGIQLVIKMMIGLMISYMATEFIDGWMGQLVAMIVTVFVLGAYTGENLWAAWTIEGMKNMTAVQLVAAVTQIASMGHSIYIQEEMEKLQSEFKDMEKSQKEKQEELEEAWLALTGNDDIDYLSITKKLIMPPAEKPEMFYSRTLNPNPGLQVYDFLNNFHEMALRLPETPGEPNFLESYNGIPFGGDKS